MASFTPVLEAYRFFAEGTESGSEALGNGQNLRLEYDVSEDFVFQLRVRIQETAGKTGATTDDYKLQYRKNVGAWLDVTTISSVVKAYNSADLTDGASTTNRLSGGSGSFIAGKVSEVGEVANFQLTSSNYTEFLYSLMIIQEDFAGIDDLVDFRVLLNGEVMTGSSTPRLINVNFPPSINLHSPEDTAVLSTIRPSFEFTGNDPEGDPVTYELTISKQSDVDHLFAARSTFRKISLASGLALLSSGDGVYNPRGLSFERGNNWFIVAGSTLYKVSLMDLTIAKSLSVGTNNHLLTDGVDIFVGAAHSTIDKISKVNTDDLTMNTIYSGLTGDIWIGIDGEYVYTLANGTYYKNKISDNSQTSGVVYSGTPESVRSTHLPKSGKIVGVYNASSESNVVGFVINTSDMSVITQEYTNTPVFSGMFFRSWAKDEYEAFYAGYLNGDNTLFYVFRILMSDLTITNTISPNYVYDTPFAFDDDCIYLVDTNSVLTARYLSNLGFRTSRSGADRYYVMTVAKGGENVLAVNSDVNSGFENLDTPVNTDPFNSGDKIKFTVQEGDELEENVQYFWKVRGKDPDA